MIRYMIEKNWRTLILWNLGMRMKDLLGPKNQQKTSIYRRTRTRFLRGDSLKIQDLNHQTRAASLMRRSICWRWKISSDLKKKVLRSNLQKETFRNLSRVRVRKACIAGMTEILPSISKTQQTQTGINLSSKNLLKSIRSPKKMTYQAEHWTMRTLSNLKTRKEQKALEKQEEKVNFFWTQISNKRATLSYCSR